MQNKRYHVISMQDGCWQYLGASCNHSEALGIAYEFIHNIMDEDDTFSVKTGYDTSNGCFEEVIVTMPETKSHSELKYPITIFYEDINQNEAFHDYYKNMTIPPHLNPQITNFQ